ncbi:MAG: SHOCT domain-containing protein [Campylobacteraceae bacterium]|nr:SHOCT domain-containing protein [Campylobacteraceae bacterium]
MFVFWIIFFYIISSIFRSNNNVNVESAFDILKKRLARGEISKEQFDDLRNHINKGER